MSNRIKGWEMFFYSLGGAYPSYFILIEESATTNFKYIVLKMSLEKYAQAHFYSTVFSFTCAPSVLQAFPAHCF